MLSQIGCITVPEEILFKISKGVSLDNKELDLYQRHPQVAHKLISQIPRLGGVANIIADQNKRLTVDAQMDFDEAQVETEVRGARILKAVLDYDKLVERGTLPSAVITEMASRSNTYDLLVIKALRELVDEIVYEFRVETLNVSDLKAGMILDQSLVARSGTMLLSEGQEMTLSFILKLASFAKGNIIDDAVQVRVPVSSAN